MTTIEEIDRTHITTSAEGFFLARVFKSAKYQTYGAARKAMKALMDSIGYESLTQTQKEIVGRWSLVNDQTEMDRMFTSQEQQEIKDFQKSHVKSFNFENNHIVSSSGYFKVGRMIYNGDVYSEILSVHVDCHLTLPGSYSVRLYDKTHFEVVAEKTDLTNTDDQIIDLGQILYQPNDYSSLELQIKKQTGDGKIKYESSQICVV